MACPTDSFEQVPGDDMKALRDVLQDSAADPFDQFAAYDRLACSDNPSVRALAAKAGLASASADVKAYVMMDALLSKDRVDVVIDPKVAQDFADYQNGSPTLYLETREISRTDGCMAFSHSNTCLEADYHAIVKGDKVEIDFNGGHGTFRLTDAGTLAGTIDAYHRPTASAYIELF